MTPQAPGTGNLGVLQSGALEQSSGMEGYVEIELARERGAEPIRLAKIEPGFLFAEPRKTRGLRKRRDGVSGLDGNGQMRLQCGRQPKTQMYRT